MFGTLENLFCQFATVISKVEGSKTLMQEVISNNILFILGIGVFGGLLGAWIFQKIKFPQVVGYIVIGLVLGVSGFKLITADDIKNLGLFNNFALGIIGFLVGGELQLATFKKYGKQFMAILLCEGVLAFLLVGGATFCVVYLMMGKIFISLAVGIVFGAIASATDPASTIDVLWENRAKGVMTTAIIAIVALDDALAMTLYGLGTAIAKLLAEIDPGAAKATTEAIANGATAVTTSSASSSLTAAALNIAIHLFGGLIIGTIFGLVIVLFMKFFKGADKHVAIAVGLLLLIIYLTIRFDMDVILAAMMASFMVTNLAPRRSEELFKLMRSFSIPIYVIFFVLVGARLSFGAMPGWLWWVVILYVICRTAGKMVGAYIGARMTGSEPSVRRYLGMGLFAQGGVAIGLSIVAAHKLGDVRVHEGLLLSDMVIYTVTATTLLVQLIGPPMVKLAVKLAKEDNRNITEEDIIATLQVPDVITSDVQLINEGASVRMAVDIFTRNDYFIYPVVNRNNKVIGLLTFDSLKDVLGNQDSWDWLLVNDIMQPVLDECELSESLQEVYDRMISLKIDQMPVVKDYESAEPAGIIDMRSIKAKVNAELIARQTQAHVA
ncbi:cation:proton antiporter [Lentisphaerota bacterium WC36G]|nr:cation:proton antiporter [Lentisphaerae bacterium WC36]